ncbi:MAG: DNA-processing protein DprA [Betaproteobacteria bacterium]
MAVDADLSHWLRLALTPGIGPRTARALLQAFGSPEAAVMAAPLALEHVVPREVAAALASDAALEGIETTLAWLDQPGNHVVTLADDDYPRSLLEIADPPVVLFVKGRRELIGAATIAIVGSRNATPQGTATARAFALALSDAGLAIVSGLALGIDAAAHEGGLEGRSGTVAVTGTGLDIVYPARNRALAHRIAERGVLVSEFALGTGALAHNFPRRNRLISGLSRGVLVVEAAIKSGSLTTARFAAEQGREVFAIPGSIHSPVSRGCHALIKQGAKLVESARDVLEELHLPTSIGTPPAEDATTEDAILTLLGHDPCDLDTLSVRAGLGIDILSARLLELELEGLVASLPGGRYQRLT